MPRSRLGLPGPGCLGGILVRYFRFDCVFVVVQEGHFFFKGVGCSFGVFQDYDNFRLLLGCSVFVSYCQCGSFGFRELRKYRVYFSNLGG